MRFNKLLSRENLFIYPYSTNMLKNFWKDKRQLHQNYESKVAQFVFSREYNSIYGIPVTIESSIWKEIKLEILKINQSEKIPQDLYKPLKSLLFNDSHSGIFSVNQSKKLYRFFDECEKNNDQAKCMILIKYVFENAKNKRNNFLVIKKA